MMEQTGMEDAEFNARGLKEIIGETRRLKDMVETLLEISRETGKPRAAAGACGRERPADAHCPVHEDPRPPLWGGDSGSAKGSHGNGRGRKNSGSFFVNLLDNAMKYGVPHEPIHVRVRLEKKGCSGADMQRRRRFGEYGGDSKVLSAPFTGRREARREQGLVGLGLTICRNIMDLHQGEMEAFLEEGRLCFQMTFFESFE